MEKTIKISDQIKGEFKSIETIRHKNALPPIEAYFYIPKGKDVVDFDDKNPYKTTRRIFEAGINFLPFEVEKLNELKVEIENYNRKNVKKLNFPVEWKENNTLRFLQATGYNSAKTIEYLIAHFEFREKTFPIKLNDKIIEILNLGFLYGHGRDQRFRPILIVNAKIYKKFKDNYVIDDWIISVMYFIEYIMNNLLVPGQVENWNIICDMDEVSVVFLPGDLKKIIEILQCNYRARLYVIYMMNISFFVKALWNMIKVMLDPNTEKKIKMIGNDKSLMFDFINKNQVEVKFGGTAKNVENYFFPHIIPDNNYLNEKEDKKSYLMPEKEYCDFIEKNPQYIKCPFIEYKRKDQEDNIVFEAGNDDSKSISTYTSSPNELNNDSKSKSPNVISLNSNDFFEVSSEIIGKDFHKNTKKINNNLKKPVIEINNENK